MTNSQTSSKAFHMALWIAQVLVALSLLMGAIMKFMPIEKISSMMPWTGQISPLLVRLLGLIDLLGALGLILPSLLKIKPQFTIWTAISVVVLMLCAIIFHVSRDEAPVIGFNIFLVILAAFIAWGRARKVSLSAK